jgi:hypothetical protein
MIQSLLNYLDGNPLLSHQACSDMTQVMKPDIAKTSIHQEIHV